MAVMAVMAVMAQDGVARERRRVTLRDVAQAAGVSKAAASRALGGYSDISLATRERIQRVAHQLGYHASVRARSLAAGKDALARCAVVNLGMTPAHFGSSFYGPVLTGIAAQASAERMDVHLVSVPGEPADSAAMLARLVAEDGADAALLLTFFPLTPADVQPLEAAGLPYVLVNRYFDAHPANCVTVDWAEATRDAVERLAGLGHRRLALLLPDSDVTTVRDHERGWRAGLAACSLDDRAAPILRFSGHEVTGTRALSAQVLAQGLPDLGEVPTALLCFNDACAHGALTVAQAAGIRVPEQVSVISFDNLHAAYTSPPLCSYDPHLHDLGVAATALLGSALRGELDAPQRINLPLDFVCRGSCALAPAPPATATTAALARPLPAGGGST